jgi:predicted TIM-barrel enzyme
MIVASALKEEGVGWKPAAEAKVRAPVDAVRAGPG